MMDTEDTDIAEVTDDTGNTDIAETPDDENTDVFGREYVESLRRESAGYRDRAKTAEAEAEVYRHRLHTELVRATGRLVDPAELPFDQSHLDDPDALTAAIDATLLGRPYLASRTPRGDVGQGNRGTSEEPFSLLGRLRGSV